MRAFGRWLLLALCLFGVAAGGTHWYLEAHPQRVLVILDASFPMAAVWDRVPAVLDVLGRHRYSVCALATDKGRIHGWRPSFELGRTVPYAPRDLKDLGQKLQLAELGEASAIYLITNASRDEVSSPSGWKIVHLGP
jgi:hypothetical protein